MRITNNMLSGNLLRNLDAAQSRVEDLQNQLASGQRINKPSDDPAGIQNAMHLKSNIASVEQWKNNAGEALQFMNTTDSTLGDMTSMLQRVRELAVQGSNGTLSTSDQSAVADEVDQLSAQLKMMANTQIGSKYIFSGTATDKELIPTDGTPSQANGQQITYVVGNDINIPVSVSGQLLFGNNTNGIIATLSSLSTALRNNDSTTVSNLLGNIDTNLDNVNSLRSDLGARVNRMTAVQNQLDSTSLNLQKYLSSIQDVDMAKSITDFTNQQNVYKAALSVGAKIIQPSLVDFIQ